MNTPCPIRSNIPAPQFLSFQPCAIYCVATRIRRWERRVYKHWLLPAIAPGFKNNSV